MITGPFEPVAHFPAVAHGTHIAETSASECAQRRIVAGLDNPHELADLEVPAGEWRGQHENACTQALSPCRRRDRVVDLSFNAPSNIPDLAHGLAIVLCDPDSAVGRAYFAL